MNGNYALSEAVNLKALEADSENWYVKKGLGLALFWQVRREDGLRLVEAAVQEAPEYVGAAQDLEALHYKMRVEPGNDAACLA